MKYLLIVLLLFSVSAAADGYKYQAKVVEVYDGDTITADIDLGFGTWRLGEKLRLARINAPEVRGKEKARGLKSWAWLNERILNQTITITTDRDKKGKYGRYIVEIQHNGENINDALVREGWAVYKDYTGKKKGKEKVKEVSALAVFSFES